MNAIGLSLAIFLVACGPAKLPEEPSIVEKKAAAEGSYGGQLQKCVDESATTKAADECAARVRAAWTKDAGAEAGK